jgi:hypothetical protein
MQAYPFRPGVSVPRKYHRPPAAKRRKSKKSPAFIEPVTYTSNSDAPVLTVDEAPAVESSSLDGGIVAPRSERGKGKAAERHIMHDYSYVKDEAVRIAIIAGLLTVLVLIAGILR